MDVRDVFFEHHSVSAAPLPHPPCREPVPAKRVPSPPVPASCRKWGLRLTGRFAGEMPVFLLLLLFFQMNISDLETGSREEETEDETDGVYIRDVPNKRPVRPSVPFHGSRKEEGTADAADGVYIRDVPKKCPVRPSVPFYSSRRKAFTSFLFFSTMASACLALAIQV